MNAIVGKASSPNTPNAVIEITDKGYNQDTPGRLLREDSAALFYTLKDTLPGGTWDRLLVSMLSYEIGGYQDRGDEESMEKAGKLIEAANIIRQRITGG